MTHLPGLGKSNIKAPGALIPVVLFFLIGLIILFTFIMKKSVFGKRTYAIGCNRDSARMAGVPVKLTIMFVYMLSGLMVGIASIVAVGRVSSAAPLAGMGMEFEAVTAVILGGAAISGGKADMVGTLLGVVMLGVLVTGLTMAHVNIYFVELVKGFVLLAAVLMNNIFEKYELSY